MTPTRNFSHLWNDLPIEERKRLSPFQTEQQILHLWQARELLVRQHRRSLAEIDKWIENLQRLLPKGGTNAPHPALNTEEK